MVKKSQVSVLLKALENGMNVSDSCALARISREYFYSKQKEDETFREQVELAEVKCKQHHISVIRKATNRHWQAAAWWLERKFKDEFSALQKLDHSGSMRIDQDDLRGKIAALPPAEQKQAYAFLAKLFAESHDGRQTQKSAA
jgi:hypothetical protein